MNLDMCSRINLSELGEKWFIELVIGSETTPIAQVATQEEAAKILQAIFHSLQEDRPALDLRPTLEDRDVKPKDGEEKPEPPPPAPGS